MLNIVTLVGVLQENPELKEFESGVKGTFITLRVVKPFKSMDGNYESEFIKCALWEGIASSTCDFCTKGDIIGIRGRLTARSEDVTFEVDNQVYHKKINSLQVIAERVAFIAVSKRKQNDQEFAYQDAE